MGMFSLRKWYLDAVTDDGRVWIAYWASVRVGPVRLAVASVLESAPGLEARARFSASGGEEPRERDGVVTWSHHGLGPAGTWTRACGSVERELLREGDGVIAWRCAAPGASVEFEAGGERLRGAGYAEVMDMTIAPWALPIRELRWGRAVARGGGAGSVVWIDWRGERARTDVFVDGAAVAGRVGDERVEGDGWALTLARDRTVRDGAIGTTALRGVPGVSAWAPAKFLTTHETKWVGRAAFAGAGGRAWEGWAIQEVVRFPERER